MKKPVLFLVLPLIAGLSFSCTGSSSRSHPDFSIFPFSDGDGLAYVTRNGENFGKEGIAYAYGEVSRNDDADAIIREINQGRSAVLFLHQENCSSCERAHDDLVSFFLDSGIEVHALDFSETTRTQSYAHISKITSTFPSYTSVMHDYVTPSFYLLKDPEKACFLNFLPERTSLQNLENYFKNLLNFPLIFNFRTLSAFQKYVSKNNCLAYYDAGQSTFYMDNVYSRAIHVGKAVARLEASYLSQEDRDAYAKEYGDSDVLWFQEGKAKEKGSGASSPDAASQLVTRYFA
ncbi:MAG: hypothetical protein K6E59_05955 [Bacilli bacterium]|nr:hypothetical protein [Bacilli bacterium]